MSNSCDDSGSITQDVHRLALRVYYENTDAQGAVYHAQYLNFAERARTEFLRCLGIDQQELKQQEGCVFVVSQLNIKYKEAVFLDDRVVVETSVLALSPFKLTLSQKLTQDKRIKAEITVDIVMIDHEKWHLMRLPESLYNTFKRILHD